MRFGKLRNAVLIAALVAIGFSAPANKEGITSSERYVGQHHFAVVNTPLTPTKKQWISYPNCQTLAVTTTHIRYPNPAAQGDTLVIAGQFGSASDVFSTIVDDQGGTLANGAWVKDKIQANAGNGQSVCILRRSNVPAGSREVTVTFTGATQFHQFAGFLGNNLAPFLPVDGTATGGNPTGTSLAAGNITTTTRDAFVIYVAAETSGTAGLTSPTRYTAPAGFTIWAPDPMGEFCCMYGTVTNPGAVNPTMTVSHSWTASTVAAVAYKTAAGVGGSPSLGGEVRYVQCVNLNSSRGQPGTTFTVDLPFTSDINLICYGYDDGTQIFGSPASNTSSSPSNTWSATTPAAATSSPSCGFVYATNASCSPTGSLTLTVSSNPSHTAAPFEIYIWGAANAGAFDQVSSRAFTKAVTPPTTESNILSSAVVTAQRNELLFYFNQEDSQTVTNITATLGTFYPLMPDHGGYESLDTTHDAGFGHMYAGDAGSTYNFNTTWSEYEGNSDQVGPVVIQVIAFMSTGPRIEEDFSGHPKRGLRR